jgi:hypothetical protein
MAIVHQVANIGPAGSHPIEPGLGDPAHLLVRHGEPSLDAGVSPNGAREPEEIVHRAMIAKLAGDVEPGFKLALQGIDARSGHRS